MASSCALYLRPRVTMNVYRYGACASEITQNVRRGTFRAPKMDS